MNVYLMILIASDSDCVCGVNEEFRCLIEAREGVVVVVVVVVVVDLELKVSSKVEARKLKFDDEGRIRDLTSSFNHIKQLIFTTS